MLKALTTISLGAVLGLALFVVCLLAYVMLAHNLGQHPLRQVLDFMQHKSEIEAQQLALANKEQRLNRLQKRLHQSSEELKKAKEQVAELKQHEEEQLLSLQYQEDEDKQIWAQLQGISEDNHLYQEQILDFVKQGIAAQPKSELFDYLKRNRYGLANANSVTVKELYQILAEAVSKTDYYEFVMQQFSNLVSQGYNPFVVAYQLALIYVPVSD